MANPELAGMHYINGYDDPEIIAGAGTLAIEALEKVADLDAIILTPTLTLILTLNPGPNPNPNP